MDSFDSSIQVQQRPSGLRPPSRFGLHEISESQSNARATKGSSMLPPPQVNLKRANNEFPQPDPKQRKTLAERAEFYPGRPNLAAATPAPRHVKANSIVGLASGIRPPTATAASSLQTRQIPGTISRPAPKSNYAISVGPGSRPPSVAGRAPASSFAKSVNGGIRSNPRSRPATAFGNYADLEDAKAGSSQQNGTTDILLSQRLPVQSVSSVLPERSSLRHRKLRAAHSTQVLVGGGSHTVSRARESSLTSLVNGIRGLDINDRGENVDPSKKAQVESGLQDDSVGHHLDRPPDGLPDSVTLRSKNRDEPSFQPASQLQGSEAASVALPKTPSCNRQYIHGLMRSLDASIKSLKYSDHPSMSTSPSKSKPPFLTRESNTRGFIAWDVDERLHDIESQWKTMQEAMSVSLTDRKALEQVVELHNNRANELQKDREDLISKNIQLESELGALRQQVQSLTLDLQSERRDHKFDVEDRLREHRHEVDGLQRQLKDELERARRAQQEAVEEAERRYRAELDEERRQNARENEQMQAQLGSKQQGMSLALQAKDREINDMRLQVESLRGDLDRELVLKASLQRRSTELTATNMALEDVVRSLKAKVEFLESDSKQQSDSFASMEARLQEALRLAEEARQKLIKEETERRVLFNKYQELKGNIRVMCRVRPVLDASEGGEAQLAFPDLKTSAQIEVGQEERSVAGTVTRKTLPFEFDRVFTPSVQNEEVFGEISQMVQSALDGYNVCIFCYGQTGSGKTYTMSAADGMIPRATHMIYETINKLREKSWSYTMEGSFVEVYNEDLHDLLTPDNKKKLSIQHDEARKTTTVVNCRTVRLDSAEKVEAMLREAQSNRSVAATKANERSSRSHSVFILKLVGENSATNERCEGTLNLVDLAGSERLKHSQAEGDRMKETQNINRSLSSLGDVIEALGKGSGHVPYRNSKLTHLLQYSLGGNSKTLMFVMVSPLEAHLKETVTSLRFATKVHNTHIGTAKSTKKLREHRES